MSKRNNFALQVANKTLKFKTAEAYSRALETISKGTFIDQKQMLEAVKRLPNGFEYIFSPKKEKELTNQFNQIEFDD